MGLKIAVNTRLLLKNRLEGIGWFTYENLIRITQNNPQHTFYFLFDRKYDDSFVFSENVVPVVLHPQARHPFLYLIWFEFSVSRFLKKNNIDVFYSPDGLSVLNTKTPSLITLHDINFEHYPQDFPKLTLWYYKKFIPKFVKNSSHITTVSEFSKKDIVSTYNIDSENVTVVYNGVRKLFHPIEIDIQKEIRDKYADGVPYFLFVGAIHGRKNLKNQMLAFDKFKNETGANHKYLIVGKKMWKNDDFDNFFKSLKHKKDIIFIGHADSETLNHLYASAEALTFVSKLEGFGIPIIEAFTCECPVITANTSSMPEVAGDAALLVEPSNIDDISNAMSIIAFDKNLRNDLVLKGKERAKYFSWDKSAQKIMDLMTQIALKQ